MPDIDHVWGDDINLSPTNDLGTVTGVTLGNQRIIRRLMTRANQTANPITSGQVGEYNAHMNYGGGLPQRIGDGIDLGLITSVVRSQIAKESVVDPRKPPAINLTTFLNAVSASIEYVVRETGDKEKLSFDVNP